MNTEEWREIQGYEGLYAVSNIGRVKGLACAGNGAFKPGRIIKPDKAGKGKYLHVRLWRNKVRKGFYIHELVALVFLGRRPEGFEINHIDGDRYNNTPANLEYISHQDNVQHAVRMGRYKGNLKLTERDVVIIRQRVASGELQKDVGRDFGITQGHISAICLGKYFKNLPLPLTI